MSENNTICGVYGIFYNVDKNDDLNNYDNLECLYIGQSANINYRWKQHIKLLRNKKHKRKDFVDWFHERNADFSLLNFIVLEECENNDEVKNACEIKWFSLLHPCFYGQVPSLKNKWEHSKTTKELVSATARKNYEKSKNYLFLLSNVDEIELMSNDDKISLMSLASCFNVSKVVMKNFLNYCEIDFVYDRRKKIYSEIDYFCPDCGGEKIPERKRCLNCYEENKFKKIPSFTVLFEDYVVKSLSLRDMACFYNVSHMTIKKWLLFYNIELRDNQTASKIARSL